MIALALRLVLSIDGGSDAFTAIDRRVTAELERMRHEERAEVARLKRHEEDQRTHAYAKFIPFEVRPFDFKLVGMTAEYVDLCLERRRVCPGPPSLAVEWLLSNRPDAFAALREWVRLRGTDDAVPPNAIGRLLSLEQAIELALIDPSPGWAQAIVHSRLSAHQSQVVFERLWAFDQERPGSQSFYLRLVDRARACEYMTGLLEKKLARGVAQKLRVEVRQHCAAEE